MFLKRLNIFLFFFIIDFFNFSVPVKVYPKYRTEIHNNIKKMADFSPIFNKTMNFEGGYQAMPSDRANYNSHGELAGTKYGVSAVSYEDYIGRPPSSEDIQAVTPEIAKDFYTKKFWNAIRGSDLKNQDVADIIFGLYIGKPAKSNQIVQASLNDLGYSVDVHNPYSDEVVNAINKSNQQKLFETIKQRSLDYVAGISANIRQGWTNKINSYQFSSEKKNG
jgi:lysozyme family protein